MIQALPPAQGNRCYNIKAIRSHWKRSIFNYTPLQQVTKSQCLHHGMTHTPLTDPQYRQAAKRNLPNSSTGSLTREPNGAPCPRYHRLYRT